MNDKAKPKTIDKNDDDLLVRFEFWGIKQGADSNTDRGDCRVGIK